MSGGTVTVSNSAWEAEQAELHGSDVEPFDRVAARHGTLGIGVGERAAQALAGGVGMAVEDQDACAHARNARMGRPFVH
jgi:hypothetical protein